MYSNDEILTMVRELDNRYGSVWLAPDNDPRVIVLHQMMPGYDWQYESHLIVDEINDEIVTYIAQGKTYKQIAILMDISIYEIDKRIRKYGLTKREQKA